HKKHHRRRSSGAGGALTPKVMMGAAVGGAIFGFIEKTFPTLPAIPLIGRSGTVAVTAYILQKKMGGGSIVRDVGLAAAVIAGYELGKDGKISGDVDGQLADQVRGISSQV